MRQVRGKALLCSHRPYEVYDFVFALAGHEVVGEDDGELQRAHQRKATADACERVEPLRRTCFQSSLSTRRRLMCSLIRAATLPMNGVPGVIT